MEIIENITDKSTIRNKQINISDIVFNPEIIDYIRQTCKKESNIDSKSMQINFNDEYVQISFNALNNQNLIYSFAVQDKDWMPRNYKQRNLYH